MRVWRHWRSAVVWGTAVLAVAVLGYWLVDDATLEQRRLRRLGEAERRNKRAAIPPSLSTSNVTPTTWEDLQQSFATAGGATMDEVKIPEVTQIEPEFESKSSLAVEIESEVRQHWQVTPLTRAGRELPAFLAEIGVVAGTSHLAKLRDRYELDISLSQLQLVRLVRLLRAAGYVFRSWQPPYPDNGYFLGRASALVRYQAVFE